MGLAVGESVRGLLWSMHVFPSVNAKAPVVVNDVNLEYIVMRECTGECGVCV